MFYIVFPVNFMICVIFVKKVMNGIKMMMVWKNRVEQDCQNGCPDKT